MSRVFRSIIVFSLVLGVASAAAAAEFPAIGKPAPEFRLRNQDANGVALSDLRGKWVVLFFYTRDFVREWATEVRNFQRDKAKYDALGVTLVGISTDGPDSHKGFHDMYKLTFDLLSDTNADVSTEYNSYIQLKVAKMSAPNTFVIDPQGNVVKIFTNINPTNHSAQVLTALAELQKPKKK